MELRCLKLRASALIFMLLPLGTLAQNSGNANFDVSFPPAGGDTVVYDVVWTQPDRGVSDYEFWCADKCFINWTQSGIEDIFVKIEWSDDASSGEYPTTFNTSADNLFLSWGKLPYNSVDEWSTKARYRWMFFPQYTPDNNGPNQLGVSDYFGINIKDWSYTKGTPISGNGSAATAGANETPSTSNSNGNVSNDISVDTNTAEGTSSPSSTDRVESTGEGSAGDGQLSTTVKIAIAVGAVVVVLLAAGILVFLLRKRQRRNQFSLPIGVTEKGIDAPVGGKPELQGSSAMSAGIPYDKAELEVSSKSQDGLSYADAKELDSRGCLAELSGSEVTERSIIHTPRRPSPDFNTLKAQEREAAYQNEADEALRRLRAEQAALHDRIRLAEMQNQNASSR